MNHRTCIVTKEKLSQREMIRFVVASGSSLFLDMHKTLPGRGFWIKAQRTIIDKAMQKNIFQRILRKNVIISADFGQCVDDFLKRKALQAMRLAFKAGFIVEGDTKVYNAIRLDQALFALDTYKDSVLLSEKSCYSALTKQKGEGFGLGALFTGEELDSALGKSNVRYIAGLRGNILSEACLESIHVLQLYRNGCSVF